MFMKIAIKVGYLLVNLVVCLANLVIARTPKVWLFGAWMGDKFADNTRYLFQYLNQNKDMYAIKTVVWVTRNRVIYETLFKMDCKVYMMHSAMSYYYHLRAGFHFICNMYSQTGKYKGDILGSLSCGAKKIQLWHGIGIKACGKMTNEAKRRIASNNSRIGKLKDALSIKILSPGCWKECFFVASSEENARVAVHDYGHSNERILIALPPRLLKTLYLTDMEINAIEIIKRAKNEAKKVILYLPTFRDQQSELYKHPTTIAGFEDFLKGNGLMWIEKRHTASTYGGEHLCENSMELSDDIDINVILDHVDLVITDYSSVSSDCIFKGIKVLSYIPDFQIYAHDDRGFVNDYDLYYPGPKVHRFEELFGNIKNALLESFFDSETEKRYVAAKNLLFAKGFDSYDSIMQQIRRAVS